MHDPGRLFKELDLKEADTVLDLGCGPGDYTIACAQLVGPAGWVYAVDKQQELLDDLTERARGLDIRNIRTLACDVTRPLPLADNSCDVCLVVTVLHIPTVSSHRSDLFAEIHRVLRPRGRLITIDVKKEDTSFGPPLHMRLTPEELERSTTEQGFEMLKQVDLGYNFMMQFAARKDRSQHG